MYSVRQAQIQPTHESHSQHKTNTEIEGKTYIWLLVRFCILGMWHIKTLTTDWKTDPAVHVPFSEWPKTVLKPVIHIAIP